MQKKSEPAGWKVPLAFAVIYLVWGTTFLAIRVGVQEVPPFLLAAIRFLVAGVALCGWTLARGVRAPSGREWRSAFALAVLIFVLDYGLLFWAERRVPSGIAAVMMATIPAFMAMFEILLLRTRRLTAGLAVSLVIGSVGVAVLTLRSVHLGGEPIDRTAAVALLVAAISWSASSALTRKLPLPSSKAMSSGAQMLAGGVLLALTAGALGEFRGFHPSAVSAGAWLALLYLILAGSILAFTAYVWLIHRQSPVKVGTYAYVNPVVAVLAGSFWGGEPLGMRTVLGSLLVLSGVLGIAKLKAST